MTNVLKKISGKRSSFTAMFGGFGETIGWVDPRTPILLIGVRDGKGRLVAHSIQFNCTKSYDELNLKKGDLLAFDARVKPDERNPFDYRYDDYAPCSHGYKLVSPSKIRRASDQAD